MSEELKKTLAAVRGAADSAWGEAFEEEQSHRPASVDALVRRAERFEKLGHIIERAIRARDGRIPPF